MYTTSASIFDFLAYFRLNAAHVATGSSRTSVTASISVSEMDAAMRHDALKYASSNSFIFLFAAVISAWFACAAPATTTAPGARSRQSLLDSG